MPAPKKVNPSQATRDVETDGEIATLNSVSAPQGPVLPEVEVDRVEDLTPPTPTGDRMVVIRVNQDIEDMSYVASGRVERYTFEAGNRYRVPVHVARELEALGKIWH